MEAARVEKTSVTKEDCHGDLTDHGSEKLVANHDGIGPSSTTHGSGEQSDDAQEDP